MNWETTSEADAELDKITPQLRAHPHVRQLRWRICAQANKWDACLDIVTVLTKLTPERRFGWIHRAHSLHNLKRTAEAQEVLLSMADTFSPNAAIL